MDARGDNCLQPLKAPPHSWFQQLVGNDPIRVRALKMAAFVGIVHARNRLVLHSIPAGSERMTPLLEPEENVASAIRNPSQRRQQPVALPRRMGPRDHRIHLLPFPRMN